MVPGYQEMKAEGPLDKFLTAKSPVSFFIFILYIISSIIIKIMVFKVAFTEQSFRNQLTKWIVTTDQPFTAVEAPAFQELIKLCNASAQIPSAGTVKNNIMKDFDEKKAKIQILLQV